MKKQHRIALLPGDGIGPEVVNEAVKALNAVAEVADSFTLSYEALSVGAGEYLKSGDPLPPATFERLKEFDAILLGAMGLPDVRWPTGVEMTPQIDLREMLDLYCGLRPIYLFHSDDSPLKGRMAGDIDFLIIRENCEGLFSSRLEKYEPDASQVTDRMLITRRGAERIIRSGFEQSMKRRQHVTLVDKANVLPSMAFFRQVFDGIASEYPDVETRRVYVDAASLYLIQRPEMFDVIVTENMFGDILSDEAAALVGGMGMAPSADIGDKYAVFQPSHGTAPDIAGKGIANPVATILSAGMMLEWLGHAEASEMIKAAVEDTLGDPAMRTPDLGGNSGTTRMGAEICSRIRKIRRV